MFLTSLILSSILSTHSVVVSNSTMVKDFSINQPNIIYVTGSISEHGAQQFKKDMKDAEDTGQPIIPIVISSYGGSVYSMLEMIDVIKKSNRVIATIVNGKAMSAAAVLFSCGDSGYRFVAPNSTIMIHEVSSGAQGKTNEIVANADETKRLNDLMLSIMSENIGRGPDYFSELIHQHGHADWFLSAQDAIDYELADKIGTPNIIMSVEVNVKLH